MGEPVRPIEHISIRVPWHDAGWNGTVCHDPRGNGTCVLLPNIGQNRRDQQEASLAGKVIADLPLADAPPCVAERATFMSPRPIQFQRVHPFTDKNPAFATFLPTPQPLLPFSAQAVPFRWMSRSEAQEIGEERQIGLQLELEEQVDAATGWKNINWVMHGDNQRTLLDAFFETVRPDRSLVFFYAKHSPLTDDTRRLLVGAATVAKVTPTGAYRSGGGERFPAQMWETTIEHSLRPNQQEGFLLPYQALLAARDDDGVDISDALAFAPEAGWVAFSYVSEHVSHDLAIDALLALQAAGRNAERILGDAARPLGFDWLEAQLNRLWKLRGPRPGLASALAAFGVRQSVTFAHLVAAAAGPDADPWPMLEQAMANPDRLGIAAAAHLTPTLRKTWQALRPERRELLQLLSRFSLTKEQAERFFVVEQRDAALTDADIIADPYLLFEADRGQREAVPFSVIDRGCFPDAKIASAYPLPRPTAMDDGLDARRVRALLVEELQREKTAGHTLCPQADLVNHIRERAQDGLSAPCPVSADVLDAHGLSAGTLPPDSPLTGVMLPGGAPALQLTELAEVAALIRDQVQRRLKAAPLGGAPDFAALLGDALGDIPGDLTTDEREAETRARAEKTAALVTLYSSRISVLIGPAGTGKTTLLKVLRHTAPVAAGGVLLVAPTGKARVQLAHLVQADAVTLAQFLIGRGRYDPQRERYLITGDPQSRTTSYKTVVVDEASMLTEEQLAALLDAVAGVQRLVLVGDPRQLPPIGAGRPFVDIVRRLAPEDIATRQPRCVPGYAELTIPRRQTGDERDDLVLANWFADGELSPAADLIWERLRSGENMMTLRAVRYQRSDLFNTLVAVLREEIEDLRTASGEEMATAFGLSYGGQVSGKGNLYFPMGAGAKADAWQILSPVRGRGWGTTEINRALKDAFGAKALAQATGWNRYNAKPIGPERIVVGDKVINIRNHTFRESGIYPKGAEAFVANGELGVAVGQTRNKWVKRPWKTEVEFSGREGVKYDYYDWSDNDRAAMLELAWAITIHKAQGSEFGITFVVLPADGAGLSRELLYTALTRQSRKVVLLHEADLNDVAKHSSAVWSDTAGRLTNLFVPSEPIEVDGTIIDRGLVHRTDGGELVRSKSEVIIANLLRQLNAVYRYEEPFTGEDGRTVRPDFTVDTDLGDIVYWEHLGMLTDPRYAAKWAEKKAWYARNGVLSYEEGGGPRGTLVITDDLNGVDVPKWRELAGKALGM
ncbi:AAA family ATPase [Micromonospora peucetia]|uniref:ATP-dependent exoDNAse (Exonuclease V), alpha subunit, helicase superfamily I n=1 Tax=Micromonospora peucetia TaxID=47871 RepID=A0A1C6W311_9ACTN|nr:AAA family ATPase [Micromonospora peucetia]MCX4391271.1 AAA family ATPase [Micromonospora peucetia]SCL72928.1 ATP-dependent exoDNAse (exonuclease V), alpha subunit, helicase superfamily I [Micromonospora peucetia]